MRRGEVYDARLDPTEGSEQAGSRPVVIVSRDAINAASAIVLAVPCTTFRPGRRIYPSQVLVNAGDGGLDVPSVVLGEQVRVLAKSRLGRRRGILSDETTGQIDRALLIALDLSGVTDP
ncbi:MAG: type II toxin-antitoxin system PemK/MazF family toxin [Chloroflexota bacterium]